MTRERMYKELNDKEQDMVLALALGLAASRGASKDNKMNYTSEDVCKKFRLKKGSYAAVQANVTRRNY